MAFFLSPIGNEQQFDANGAPLNAGRIYTYLAGSTTPTATYTDNTGGTQQANPIILNSLGLPASPIWLGGGITYKFVIKDSADVTLRTVDNISGINDTTATQTEWVSSGFVPTFISTVSFSVPGDQTGTLQIGRRLRTQNAAGLIYSRITNSVFAATITTVTVVNDSGVLDSGLSVVSYGLLASTNNSIPYFPKRLAQIQTFQTGAVATGTTLIPLDDTVPQNTEGDQYMSLAFTPVSATSLLEIDVVLHASFDVASNLIVALFQSGNASALAASLNTGPNGIPTFAAYKYVMTSGTTSAITFTVRAGGNSAGTMTFNGIGGARLLGGVQPSRITIKEYLP